MPDQSRGNIDAVAAALRVALALPDARARDREIHELRLRQSPAGKWLGGAEIVVDARQSACIEHEPIHLPVSEHLSQAEAFRPISSVRRPKFRAPSYPLPN